MVKSRRTIQARYKMLLIFDRVGSKVHGSTKMLFVLDQMPFIFYNNRLCGPCTSSICAAVLEF